MNDVAAPDLSAQIKKIADHLVFLEKKLDTLLEQRQERRPFPPKFGGNREFSGQRGNNFNRQDKPHYGPPRRPGGGHPHSSSRAHYKPAYRQGPPSAR